MVRDQIASRGVRDPRVLDALRRVPRHWFVPSRVAGEAYDDHPLPIGFGQTISQPYIVALMTEALRVAPTDRVLEIGTGSGYQAAVLSELAREVYTIEIVRPLGELARRILRERGYENVHVRIGDGFGGWPEAAPFDAIIVTCAAPTPPAALVEQLRIGGRLCIPVDAPDGFQELILFRKRDDGGLDRQVLAPVMFVPMTGEAQRKR